MALLTELVVSILIELGPPRVRAVDLDEVIVKRVDVSQCTGLFSWGIPGFTGSDWSTFRSLTSKT